MAVAAFESVWDRDISVLDGPGLVDRFAMLEQERRHIEAELAELIGEVDRREVFRDDQHASVKGWCRALGRWSDGEARARVRTARLSDAVPQVAEALADGLLGVAQCHEIARVFANPRVGEQVADVVEIFLEHARLMPFEDFQRLVRAWESMVDADGAHRCHEASHRNRRASMLLDETTVVIRASGGALDGAEMLAIFQRFQDAEYAADWAQARAEHDPDAVYAQLPRDAGQRAWDALHQIFEDAASTPPGAQAPQPVLNLVADIHTFEQALREYAGDLAGDSSDGDRRGGGFGARPVDPRL